MDLFTEEDVEFAKKKLEIDENSGPKYDRITPGQSFLRKSEFDLYEIVQDIAEKNERSDIREFFLFMKNGHVENPTDSLSRQELVDVLMCALEEA